MNPKEIQETVMSDDEIKDSYAHMSQPRSHPAVHKRIAHRQAEITANKLCPIAEKEGMRKVMEEITRLALISDDTTLKSYVVGLLEQVRSKFGKPNSKHGV